MAKSQNTFQQVYQQWLAAVAGGHEASARSHARTLLDAIQFLGAEHGPGWKGKDRTFFYNWCDREGLMPSKDSEK